MNKWISSLKELEDLTIKRYLFDSEPENTEPYETRQKEMFIEGFGDWGGSQEIGGQTYSAWIGIRLKCKTGRNPQIFRTKLVASKSKLININQSTSIPRLELGAAMLLDKLPAKVRKPFPFIPKENFILNTESW